MRMFIRIIMIGAIGLALSLSALAQEPAASPTPSQADVDAKAALYEKFTVNYSTNSELAYAAAKEYGQKWPDDASDGAKYMKDWAAKFEKLKIKLDLTKAIDTEKWAEAFSLGKQVLANEPNDLTTNLNTAFAGMKLAMASNNANNAEAGVLANKSIAMVQAAKTLADGKPYPEKTKGEQFGWLNYSLYLYSLANKQSDAAAGFLIKAVQFENAFKNDPNTYLKLAAIYSEELEKRRLAYSAEYDGKPKTPEGDAAFERLKQQADLLIDAMARAIAYSSTDVKTQQARDDLKKDLTGYYKFRHGNVDGIDALIAGIKSKPIAQPGATPAPVAPSAPATVGNTAEPAKTTATTPAETKTPATSTPTTPVRTPAGTP